MKETFTFSSGRIKLPVRIFCQWRNAHGRKNLLSFLALPVRDFSLLFMSTQGDGMEIFMKTLALVGKSGTGKSYRSLDLARENNIKAIIDDGLLIFGNRILAGSSAKHEKTRMASVKRAIFSDDSHARSLQYALQENEIDSVLILGTSDKMVNQIASRLNLLPIEKTFYIEDIATPEEIETAAVMRNQQGKHVIPAPVFEVKKQFSGYFLRSLIPHSKRNLINVEETIIRPTYSYLGEFKISPKVFSDICIYEISKLENIAEVLKVKSIPLSNGYINIYIEIALAAPCSIPELGGHIQKVVASTIEDSTSIIVNSTDILVKNIKDF